MPFGGLADIDQQRLEFGLHVPAGGRHASRGIVEQPLDQMALARRHQHGGSGQEHGRAGSVGELDAELDEVPALLSETSPA